MRSSKYLPKIGTFDGARFWKNAFAHQRGNLLRKVQVPDDQIKVLIEKAYADLPAPLRFEIETSGIKEQDLK
ncbi:hypothetical protein [Candidatus Nitrosotenuis cloacae]|uniref:hypothetical protein n=1 Tax=Candidatus Nitrosotenuis cloacae TaxID=1603555 RepID=UPI00227DA24F|nr:hypothetical protein [Candidatus Nitrosotenuis cloacae]